MIGSNKAAHPKIAAAFVASLLAFLTGCNRSENLVTESQSETTLSIGFGLTTGQTLAAGLRETARGIAVEGLVIPANDGRPQPRLAAKWSPSADRLKWVVQLRPGTEFHNGKPVTAETVREILVAALPGYMGPAFEDIEKISASSEYEIEFLLKKPSNFLLEALDVPIQQPSDLPIGTGPFHVTRTGDEVEMRANEKYHAGRPLIDRIVFSPYASVRSAWADMLRGRVDMLYDVGIDALDSLQPSKQAEVFTFRRPYAYIALLNVRRKPFQDPAFRRTLNAAIDRSALVTEALRGHGAPADGAVWPDNWAYDSKLPRFRYDPHQVHDSSTVPRFTCLYSDPTHERIALVVQRQLQAVGIDVVLEALPVDQALERVQAGNFDVFLADAAIGGTLFRTYRFWHSGGAFNWGHFKSGSVDSALDTVRHAANDDEYKAGVAAFQRAIIDDPPAIFLAWSERARAVSTRFEVPAEPGRDILSTLRLWRPLADKRMTSPN
jgi:peptide/nickel transport system substrate-binding protein